MCQFGSFFKNSKIIKNKSMTLSISKALKSSHNLANNFKFSQKQIASLSRTSDVALAIIATAGIITVAAIAPNILSAVHELFLKKHRRHLKEKQAKIKTTRVFYYLKRSGLIQLQRSEKDWKISLTLLGKSKVSQFELATLSITKPKFWDGKWWLIAADIPTEHYRASADLLRKKLKVLNFFPLQRTLWVFPYDPRNEIQFLAKQYNIAEFITVMEISRLDKDDEKKIKKFLKNYGIL
jgi:hypothetical protein